MFIPIRRLVSVSQPSPKAHGSLDANPSIPIISGAILYCFRVPVSPYCGHRANAKHDPAIRYQPLSSRVTTLEQGRHCCRYGNNWLTFSNRCRTLWRQDEFQPFFGNIPEYKTLPPFDHPLLRLLVTSQIPLFLRRRVVCTCAKGLLCICVYCVTKSMLEQAKESLSNELCLLLVEPTICWALITYPKWTKLVPYNTIRTSLWQHNVFRLV